MDGGKVFCPECRKDVEYTLEDGMRVEKVMGVQCAYRGKTARCPLCGGELWIDEIGDTNLKMLHAKYREIKKAP